jgi:hypothetical protein
MRALTLIVIALVLTACAAPAPQPIAANGATGSGWVATLAPLGSFDWHAAPVLTQNIVLRQRATNALKKGRIDKATALQLLDLTDQVRTAYDAAIESDAAKRPADATRALETAKEKLAAAAAILDRSKP